jgi:hypothetical protein
MRIAVRITGSASGNSILNSRCRSGHADAAGGVVCRARHARKPDNGVGDDRQQRIEKQRDKGRRSADAADADRRSARHIGGDPAERRDQQAEKRDRRDGLDEVQRVEHAIPQRRHPMTEDAERQPDQDCGKQRAERQFHMLARLDPEDIGAVRNIPS